MLKIIKKKLTIFKKKCYTTDVFRMKVIDLTYFCKSLPDFDADLQKYVIFLSYVLESHFIF